MCEKFGSFRYSQSEIDTAKEAMGLATHRQIPEKIAGFRAEKESEQVIGIPEKKLIGIDLGRKDVKLGRDTHLKAASFVTRRTKS